MTKILKKDIVIICNCIQSLSYEHIKENSLHAFYKGFIRWCNIEPYTCKEVSFIFSNKDEKIIITADNKKNMYIKLLELYESGLNSWIELLKKILIRLKKKRKDLTIILIN